MSVSDRLLHSAAGKQWKCIGVQTHNGILIPLFSLHSHQSSGIGEYLDLISLIDWCNKMHLDVIQLLPLNDLGRGTSPYGAISAFALNPLHLSLSQLPHIDHYPELIEVLQQLARLNESERVNYPLVIAGKEHFLQKYFLLAAHHFTSTYEYKAFLEQNEWLYEYALFKALKCARQWRSWEEWEKEIRDPTPEKYKSLQQEYSVEVNYHIFVQFLCFQQWKKVKEAAEEKGVLLKGDIPILIDRESVDVWRNRHLFFMDLCAGAPPDMYSDEGQNWGFPIYNWTMLEHEDYQWWKRRLAVAGKLYHLYRIDHIVGFFRIWTVPPGRPGKEGHFFPQDQNLWIPNGEKIMRMMLDNCAALPIGEDLGNVPTSVRVCLRKLGICGTKVMRWERVWNEDKRFIPFAEYIPESMTTVSTHDSETLQQWWRDKAEEAKDFAQFKNWNYEPELSLERQAEILYDSNHTPSLFHVNALQEYLALVPGMTWPNIDDERVNVPGIVSDFNWTYRFRPTVEQIVSSEPLQEAIKNLI